MKKILGWVIGFILVAVVASLFLIPTETTPPDDTRMILEYTKETYIAPPCFEQADPTNNIEETDLESAKEMYEANGACTNEELEPEKDTLGTALLKKIGLMNTKWDEW